MSVFLRIKSFSNVRTHPLVNLYILRRRCPHLLHLHYLLPLNLPCLPYSSRLLDLIACSVSLVVAPFVTFCSAPVYIIPRVELYLQCNVCSVHLGSRCCASRSNRRCCSRAVGVVQFVPVSLASRSNDHWHSMGSCWCTCSSRRLIKQNKKTSLRERSPLKQK